MKDLLNNLFKTEIKDKAELIAIMRRGVDAGVIDFESMLIIEAVLQISKLQVRDIMIPRLQMDVLDINDDIRAIATKIITTGHSRFPIIDKEISNVIGIFHSKDLIRYFLEEENFNLKEYLRQAYFVPEIK
ncbi:MAG TPA: CBS domain-containing protein, partial [Burkholderiales bacterium]|nr:CBS domain-containing protein [Burkholderiales bacterium]